MALDVRRLDIPDVMIIRPKKHADHRGFFSETYNKQAFSEAGISVDFVQDNHAYSKDNGTVRGLHYQAPPFAQDKLVRVIRGRIFDVAVDIRRSSPTYGQYVAAEISADDWNQIFIPIGFAHGLCTLEPDTEVLYKVSNYFSPKHDLGVRWNDPDISIDWPLSAHGVKTSDKDAHLPVLRDAEACF